MLLAVLVGLEPRGSLLETLVGEIDVGDGRRHGRCRRWRDEEQDEENGEKREDGERDPYVNDVWRGEKGTRKSADVLQLIRFLIVSSSPPLANNFHNTLLDVDFLVVRDAAAGATALIFDNETGILTLTE